MYITSSRKRLTKSRIHLASLTINTPAALENPLGAAVNPDGSLKDAREIEWLHSPSDETVPVPTMPVSALHWHVRNNVRKFLFVM